MSGTTMDGSSENYTNGLITTKSMNTMSGSSNHQGLTNSSFSDASTVTKFKKSRHHEKIHQNPMRQKMSLGYNKGNCYNLDKTDKNDPKNFFKTL